MKKIILLFSFFICLTISVFAQEYAIGTTTALWKYLSVNTFLDAKKNRIEYIEVAFNQSYRGVPEEEVIPRIKAMKAKVDSTNIKVWSIHLPFSKTLDISVLNDEMRKKNVTFIAEMIELSAIFNPQRLVLHPSSEPIADSVREQRIQKCIESIDYLRKYAEKVGIQLCVENLPRTCLGNTPEELLRIITDFPDVGICFDTNHYSKGDPVHFVKIAGSRIKTIHVSDYDGVNECHWIPGDGTIRWGELVYQLKKTGYNGVFMYETTKNSKKERATPNQLEESYKMIEREHNSYNQQLNK